MYPIYWLVEVSVYVKRSEHDGWHFYCFHHSWHISPANLAGKKLHFGNSPKHEDLQYLVWVADNGTQVAFFKLDDEQRALAFVAAHPDFKLREAYQWRPEEVEWGKVLTPNRPAWR